MVVRRRRCEITLFVLFSFFPSPANSRAGKKSRRLMLPASRTLTSSSPSSPRQQVVATTGKATVRASLTLPSSTSTSTSRLHRSPPTTKSARAIPAPSLPLARRTAMAAASSPSSATAVAATKDKTVRFWEERERETVLKNFRWSSRKKNKLAETCFSQPPLCFSFSLSSSNHLTALHRRRLGPRRRGPRRDGGEGREYGCFFVSEGRKEEREVEI
jgi:hypothetical protein